MPTRKKKKRPFIDWSKNFLGEIPIAGDMLGLSGDGTGAREREAQEAALDEIMNIGAPPSMYELMGLGSPESYFGQVPQEYIDNYISQYGGGTSGVSGGGSISGGSGGTYMQPGGSTPATGPRTTMSVGSGDVRGAVQDSSSGHLNLMPVVQSTSVRGISNDQRDLEAYAKATQAASSTTLDPSLRGGGDGTRGHGTSEADLIRQAQEQYVREMMSDPYFGLNQYVRPEMADAQADQHAIDMQRRALDQFGEIYDAGGYTDAERAQMRLAQQNAAAYEQSQRGAVEQQMAMRGMGNSGASLASMLAAQQGGANRASNSADQIAIAGQQRALQALANQGQMAGQIRGQSWTEDTARRGAVDAWNNSNTSLRNNWLQQRGQAAQQAWNDEARLADLRAGAYMGNAGFWGLKGAANDAQDAANYQLVGQAVGAAVGGPAGAAVGGQAANSLSGGTQNQDPSYWTDLSGGATGIR